VKKPRRGKHATAKKTMNSHGTGEQQKEENKKKEGRGPGGSETKGQIRAVRIKFRKADTRSQGGPKKRSRWGLRAYGKKNRTCRLRNLSATRRGKKRDAGRGKKACE